MEGTTEKERRKQEYLPGTLQVSTSGGVTRYYHVIKDSEKGDGKRRYLKKQQEYETQLLAKAKRQYIHEHSALKSIEKNAVERRFL